MQTKKQILEVIQKIVEHNEKQLNLVDGDQCTAKNLYTFEFEGISVYDPMYDPTLRFSVDPIEFYGEENIHGLIKRYKEQSVE